MKLLLSLLLAMLIALSSVSALSAQDGKSDDEIYDRVRQRLVSDPEVKGGALTVDVKDGVVTLKGTVDKEKARQKAEKLAKKVKGVRAVNNQLQVKSSLPL
ncbi:MAG: BON domain-containing protein [Bryobacteraceae bacterium]|nr:BON domain-containing protein [Bryobacteraceae bacterium]